MPSAALFVPYTLFFLEWEFLEYSMERWKLTFRAKLRFALANILVFCSFGAGAALFVLFLPVLKCLSVP